MSDDVDVLIVGAGHGGLGVAARLKRHGRSPVLVDAAPRIGDTWRRRWPSLRLFTPRFVNKLPGMPFPDGADPFPGKDEVAEYQQRYAEWLRVPLRLGARVDRATPRADGSFDAFIGGEVVRARNVVVTTGAHHTPRIPAFAARLGGRVTQLHSCEYGTFGPLPDGPVLVIGARNSGVEIAMDLGGTHEVTVAIGKHPRYAPARWRSPTWWRLAQLRGWLLRGASLPGPLPWPLKPPAGWVELDIDRARREGRLSFATRAIDADGATVRFADGSEMRPRTLIWATGFRLDDSWIDVPLENGAMRVGQHRRGPVPGLWVNRANLLGSLHWGALDIAADIAR